jgi:hypothetical protein
MGYWFHMQPDPGFVVLNRLEEHTGGGGSLPKFKFNGW